MQRIFLIGPMGSGKTTLGRLIAGNLGYQFIDSDKEIEERTGATIPTIFDYEGEVGFRNREAMVIEDLTRHRRIVLSTGGGSILRLENREALNSRGFVVYLKVSPRIQMLRTAKDKNRPLLQTPDPFKTLTELSKVRTPLYEETAHFSISTDNVRTNVLKNRIIRAYREHTEVQKHTGT